MHGWGFERCVSLLLQLLLPLPLVARSAALAQLQSKLASQLLSYLGTSLERVLESERSCQVRGMACLLWLACRQGQLPGHSEQQGRAACRGQRVMGIT